MTEPCEKVNVNGHDYIRVDLVAPKPAVDGAGRPFVIVRAREAGVFAGYLTYRNDSDQVVTLDDCIRLHQWTGCSLSQVANDGTAPSNHENRFSMPTNDHSVLGVIEIIPATERARLAIQAVKTWRK